ncbi:ATP-binding protein [Mesorhizobium sp. M8A.F.Ca.ET.213.01.1.1]|uniref:ATP-binding protein n=1 Tax=Mesorhizobium sp. M8A.F.Ca.ET.213.01.1.1 TaxID=2563970 RepID=UPI00387EA379
MADNGAGVTPAVVEKVTIPLYSARAGNYTGLGLTACSHMVSTLKGKLFISRIPDAGTVVHVKVPYHPRRCNRLAADDDSSGPTAAAGVLV